MSVRAKFKCYSKTQSVYGESIKMFPVTSGSQENEQFFKWTPSGTLEMGIVNPDAAKQFEVGKEYYLNFELADPAA